MPEARKLMGASFTEFGKAFIARGEVQIAAAYESTA
jgi:hypothetical protein